MLLLNKEIIPLLSRCKLGFVGYPMEGLNNIYCSPNKIYEYPNVELNKDTTESKYLKRVKEGFKEVLKYGGTGSGYMDLKNKPAGKTGTSQSFVDTDGDGKIDKETISNAFVAYAPYDNPEVTFTVISPDIYNYDNNSNYQTNVNKRIVKRVTDLYFKKYSEK